MGNFGVIVEEFLTFGAGTGGEAEGMDFGKTNLLAKIVSLLEVSVGFVGETDDDIGAKPKSPLAPPFDKGGSLL